MFDHVTITVSDRAASEEFYATVLATLGIEPTHTGGDFTEWRDFSLTGGSADRAVTRRLHLGFAAPSHEHVDEFWRAGTAAGYRDDGAPGPRPQYSDDYYGAFLLDPDGNSAEGVHHGRVAEGDKRGIVDHLWIRVADVAESKSFYEAIAPHAGFDVRFDSEDRVRFGGGAHGSFSIVSGEPTEALHMAFPATDDETVQRFHRAALEHGAPDNGAPGERPVYHAGYYAAFVLDPDGNNVEVVNHNRG